MKLFRIVLSLLIVIGLLVGAVLYFTRHMTSQVDLFIESVSRGDHDSAYAMLSQQFQQSVSRSHFEDVIKRSGLTGFKSSSWSSRSITTATGSLSGTITLRDGATIPLQFDLVREAGEWKIYALNRKIAGYSESPDAGIPDRTQAAQLIKDTTLNFATAINQGAFDAFHRELSVEFQEQVPLADFDQAFGAFIQRRIDLTPLQKLDPLLTVEPAVDANGVLLLQGYYLSHPTKVHFTYRYLFKHVEWQLLGINVQLKPVGEGS